MLNTWQVAVYQLMFSLNNRQHTISVALITNIYFLHAYSTTGFSGSKLASLGLIPSCGMGPDLFYMSFIPLNHQTLKQMLLSVKNRSISEHAHLHTHMSSPSSRVVCKHPIAKEVTWPSPISMGQKIWRFFQWRSFGIE